MIPAPFSVQTTAAFDREFRKLAKHHRDLIGHYRDTVIILANDPYNRRREHNIKKLEGAAPGDGQ
jgi:mRNA-degrading endonuclease RelE of RelBE toxin-antitoxin system